jgi:hypothetical protein
MNAYADEVKFVLEVVRHGARTDVFPDPFDSPWTPGIGKLTKVGMKQQFDLGKSFRADYGTTLIQEEYVPY